MKSFINHILFLIGLTLATVFYQNYYSKEAVAKKESIERLEKQQLQQLQKELEEEKTSFMKDCTSRLPVSCCIPDYHRTVFMSPKYKKLHYDGMIRYMSDPDFCKRVTPCSSQPPQVNTGDSVGTSLLKGAAVGAGVGVGLKVMGKILK